MTVLINNEYFLHATFQTSRRDSVKFSYIFGVRYQKKYTNINFTKMLSQNLLIYDSHGIVSSRTWTAFFYIDRKVIKNAKFNFLNFQKKKKGTWKKNPQVWSPSDQTQKKKRKKKRNPQRSRTNCITGFVPVLQKVGNGWLTKTDGILCL